MNGDEEKKAAVAITQAVTECIARASFSYEHKNNILTTVIAALQGIRDAAAIAEPEAYAQGEIDGE